MTAIDITLPRPHAAQTRLLRESRRYNVAACGRRFGKSTLAHELLLRPALEGYPVAYFAPTYKLLLDMWRSFERLTRKVLRRSNATEHRIELITSGILDFWTLEDPDAGRSRKYRRVFIDEAGLVAALEDRWQAAIRPTLADYEGDAWLAGTPKGRNFFWRTYQWGQDPAMPEWVSWQLPTAANPFIKPSEIDAMRAVMTERTAAQELDAVFLEDGGGVFRGIRALATAHPQARAADGHHYVMGVDWGRTNDATVLVVIDVTLMQVCAVDRMLDTDYTLQTTRLRGLWERFGQCVIIAEQNSMGGPLVERLAREGLRVRGFVTTNATKAGIIDALALAFETSALALLNDPALIGELEAYEAETLPSGLIRYSAPAGMHDDHVMALALAYSGVGRASSAVGAFL